MCSAPLATRGRKGPGLSGDAMSIWPSHSPGSLLNCALPWNMPSRGEPDTGPISSCEQWSGLSLIVALGVCPSVTPPFQSHTVLSQTAMAPDHLPLWTYSVCSFSRNWSLFKCGSFTLCPPPRLGIYLLWNSIGREFKHRHGG